MLTVRPTLAADTPAIHALIGGIYREYDCTLRVELEERHLIDPGGYFRSHGGEFWVVSDGAAILATCGVLLHDGVAELKTLYVHRALRRQGWGKRLVERAMDFARDAGIARMTLWSDTRFVDAHRLYERLGFQRGPETRPLHDSNNSIEYYFERPLGRDVGPHDSRAGRPF